jgi:hypothetical protein
MMNAGDVMACASALVGLGLGDGHGGRLQLARQTRLVALLQDSGLAEQRADGVGRLRADVEPVVDARRVEVDRWSPVRG